MKLKISGIKNAGNLEKERIILQVLEDDDVGRYAIFKSKKIETKVSSRVLETFWFQDQLVKKDDLVVVYTKAGIYKSIKHLKGTTFSHFFYWDKENPIWTNSQDDVAVLLNVSEWDYITT